jgi:methionyl aminopeptidase
MTSVNMNQPLDEQYVQDLKLAGSIARQAVEYGISLIKPGASYLTVMRLVEEKIRSLGAIPAFPPQMALDDVAAHFICDPQQDIIFQSQLVSLDLGACVNGAIGDVAMTVDLSGKHQLLVDTAKQAVHTVIAQLKVSMTLHEVGQLIEQTIQRAGLRPIVNLSGHGLGLYQIHTPPNIPNYANGSSIQIRPGMVFAIEPFVTTGIGKIYDAGNPLIYSFIAKKPVRSTYAKQLLSKITTFQGLPFSLHQLLDADMTQNKALFGLKELIQAGIIVGHAPLIEVSHAPVAQWEHTVVVENDGTICVTTLRNK